MKNDAITFPEKALFSTEIRVRVGDINYGGHLGNDAVLVFAQEARLRFLATAGLSEIDAGGSSLIMTDAKVVYLTQAYLGDELIVDVAANEVKRARFHLVYRLRRPADKFVIALVSTGLACFDYEKNKPARMGSKLKELLQCNESER